MKRQSSSIKQNRILGLSGFTLIEVLIALVIIGITLPALILRVQTILDNTGHTNEKTVAYWVAESEFEEIRMEHYFYLSKNQAQSSNTNSSNSAKKGRSFKDSKKTINFAGNEWFLEVKHSKMDDIAMAERVTQVDVSAALEEGKPVATLTGFLYE